MTTKTVFQFPDGAPFEMPLDELIQKLQEIREQHPSEDLIFWACELMVSVERPMTEKEMAEQRARIKASDLGPILGEGDTIHKGIVLTKSQ